MGEKFMVKQWKITKAKGTKFSDTGGCINPGDKTAHSIHLKMGAARTKGLLHIGKSIWGYLLGWRVAMSAGCLQCLRCLRCLQWLSGSLDVQSWARYTR